MCPIKGFVIKVMDFFGNFKDTYHVVLCALQFE